MPAAILGTAPFDVALIDVLRCSSKAFRRCGQTWKM